MAIDFSKYGYAEPKPTIDFSQYGYADDDESGFFGNTLAGAGQRALSLGSDFVGFLNNLAQEGEKYLADFTGINPYIKFGEDGISFEMNAPAGESGGLLDPVEQGIDNVDLGYQPRFTWEGLKGDVSVENVAGYVVEQGVQSVPDMVAALTTLPAYIAARTNEIAEVRAENQGRDEVNVLDLGQAAVPAIAISALEKIGAKGIFASKADDTIASAALRGASREGTTEFIQEPIEYAGETIGTDVAFDPATALDRGFAGAVAGAGIGGPLGATSQAILPTQSEDEQSFKGLEPGQLQADFTARQNEINRLIEEGLTPDYILDEMVNGLNNDFTLASQQFPSFEFTLNIQNAMQDVAEQGGDNLEVAGAGAEAAANSAPNLNLDQRSGPASNLGRTLQPDTNVADALILADRDMRSALETGDVDAANDINEDAVQLRLAQQLYQRAAEYESQGEFDLASRLRQRGNAIMQEDAGRRAAFQQQNIQPEPAIEPEPFLALEDRRPPPLEGDVIPAQPIFEDVTSDFESRDPIEEAPLDTFQRRVQERIDSAQPRIPFDPNTYQEPAQSAPDVFYQGSRGDGFATRKGANAALRSRERAEPTFNWEVYEDPNTGRFALAGFRKEAPAPREQESPTVNAQRALRDAEPPAQVDDDVMMSPRRVSDIGEAREQRDLRNYRNDLMEKIDQGVQQRIAITETFQEADAYDGLQVGDTYITTNANGDQFRNKVVGLTASRVGGSDRNPVDGRFPAIAEEDILTGPDGREYKASLRVETINPQGEVMESSANMYRLRELGYEKMGGLRSADQDVSLSPRRDAGGQILERAPVIDPEILRGKTIRPTLADLTDAGRDFTGIDSSQIDEPVPLQGGPKFPLLSTSTAGEVVWAVNDKGGMTKLQGSDYVIVSSMGIDAHKSNSSVGQAMLSTLNAYLRDGRISQENLQALDTIVERTGLTSPKLENREEYNQWVQNLTFDDRAKFITALETKEAQALGAPNMKKILRETIDKEYAGGNIGDGMLVIEVEKGPDARVELGTEGTEKHLSYKYGVKGRVVGKLPRNTPYKKLFPDFFERRRAEGKPESGDYFALRRGLPIQTVNDDVFAAINKAPLESVSSSRQAQLIAASYAGNWKSSSFQMNDAEGRGVSPQNFIDAINSSESSATLTPYSLPELRKEIRSGKTSVYQLSDGEIFFALKRDYNYNDEYGVDLAEAGLSANEIAVTGVVNNEVSAGGVGAPAVMMKAIEEGATVLDAYSVKSKKHPEGFLPSLYADYGFEQVATIPFDPAYIEDANQLRDLEAVWDKYGWDRDQGYPDIVVMKWRGTDDQRSNATKRFFGGQGQAGFDARPVDDIIGAAGGTAQPTIQPDDGQVSGQRDNAGDDTGTLRTGDRAYNAELDGTGYGGRTGSRARDALRELQSLTDDELGDLGVDPASIKTTDERPQLSPRREPPQPASVDTALARVRNALRDTEVPDREDAGIKVVLPDSIPTERRDSFTFAAQTARAFQKSGVLNFVEFEQGVTGFNGATVSGQIFIDVNAEQPYHVVLGHELTHVLRRDYADLYQQLEDMIIPQGTAREESARQHGYDMDSRQGREEYVADVVGNRFGESEFWQSMAEANPKGFRRIAQVARSLMQRLADFFRDRSLPVGDAVQDLNRVRSEITKVMSQYKDRLDQDPSGPIPDSQIPEVMFSPVRERTADVGVGTAEGGAVDTQAQPDQTPEPPRTDSFAEENKRIREEDVTIVDKIKREARRQLAPGGLLPNSVFEAKIDRDNRLATVEFDTTYYVNKLERAVKKATGKRFASLDPAMRARIQDSLTGNMDETLPAEVKEAVIGMRQSIDGLSKKYVSLLKDQTVELIQELNSADMALLNAYKTRDDAIIAQAKSAYTGNNLKQSIEKVNQVLSKVDLFTLIENNVGEYVHRSYKAFDDPNWFSKVPDSVLNNARTYLMGRMTESGMSETAARERTEVVLNDILKEGTAYGSMEAFIKESKLGSKDLSILKKRQDIAPEIRALLGQYEDPRINYAKTTAKMARLIYNSRFLDRVKDVGMGEFLFTEDNRPPNMTKIAVDGSKVMEPLNGLYAPREVAQAFSDMGKSDWGAFLEGVVRVNGAIKYGKTVLSPTTQIRNFMSAAFFAINSGHFDVTKTLKSLSVMREYFSKTGSEGKIAYLRRLKELGVVYDTPYAGEMMRLLEESKLLDIESQESDGAISSSLKYVASMATRFYQFGDDFWKIVGFENEKQNLIASGMTSVEAETEAAKRVRNTYPTYSMVGKGINTLRRFPLAGTFVSFPAEIIRTSYNNIKIAAEDMKNPQRRSMGIKRLAGIAITSANMYAIQEWSKQMFDVSDDEEEAIRLMAPYWQENSNFFFNARDEDGNRRYFDVSFLDPYNYFKRPINAALKDQPWEESFVDAARDMVLPFFGTDILAGSLFEVLANKKSTGAPVTEADGYIGQGEDFVKHIWDNIRPGILNNIEGIQKAHTEYVTSYGKDYKMDDEVMALMGWRVSTFNPKTALKFRTYDIKEIRHNAQKLLNRAIVDPNLSGDEGIEDALDNSLKMRERAFTHSLRLIEGARAGGMTDDEIFTTLTAGGISKRESAYLIDGEMPPMSINPATVKKEYRNAIGYLSEEKAEEIFNRYGLALDMLDERQPN